MQFHTAPVAGASNGRMTRIYQALGAQSTLCIIKPASLEPRADFLVQEHTGILDLLEPGNGEELHKAIKGHMQKPSRTSPQQGLRRKPPTECFEG
jgi:DNA-binding GntR family transcriptional regulator